MDDPGEFGCTLTLRDGTPVCLRAARPDDRDRIVAAFDKLEPQSVYTRFFSYRKALGPADLDRLKTSDGAHGMALVATIDGASGETVIAGGSYVVHPGRDGVPTAEVAFTVEEDYQGQGLAGRLLESLAAIARAHGIERLDAEVLAGNAPMLNVFERSGLPVRKRREGDVVHVEMDLVPPADAGPVSAGAAPT